MTIRTILRTKMGQSETAREPRSGRRGRRVRQHRSERGASLVEFAIVLPVLVTLLLGTIELGFMMRAKHAVVTAARGSARAAANQGDERLADYAAIDSVLSVVQAQSNVELVSVSVFKPTTSGEIPAGCSTSSVNGLCNFYNEATLASIMAITSDAGRQTLFSPTCGNTIDSSWCPTTRDAKQKGGLDGLGVRVVFRRDGFTGLFGNDQLITSESITRLEPETE